MSAFFNFSTFAVVGYVYLHSPVTVTLGSFIAVVAVKQLNNAEG